jgi:hypothetical protein
MYGQIFSLIDGGMFANNPALCAYAEARKIPFAEVLKNHQKANYPTVNDLLIISIGTGIEARPYSFKKLEKAGKIGWVNPIIDILMSANAETVDYQLGQMFQTLGSRNQKKSFQIGGLGREELKYSWILRQCKAMLLQLAALHALPVVVSIWWFEKVTFVASSSFSCIFA